MARSHVVACMQEQHRPALLITDCSDKKDPPSDQGERLCSTIVSALNKGGHVLVPVDTSARVPS